jgi:hypothetical protein
LKDLDHSPNDPGFKGDTPQDNLVYEATPEVYDIVLDSTHQSAERNQLIDSKRGQELLTKLENENMKQNKFHSKFATKKKEM